MDPRLIEYYHRELQHVRETGAEFAKEYPKIAGRLGMEGIDCADPYVERLLEGFAFLAARVQLKIDSEFPKFSQHLLETVYPHFLAPTPSMAIMQFQPDLTEGGLSEGLEIPRQSVLRSRVGRGDTGSCEFRTGTPVTLWPLELVEAEYHLDTSAFRPSGLREPRRVAAALRLRVRATAGLTLSELALESLSLYLRGTDEGPMHIYEQFLANAVAVVAQPVERPAAWQHLIDRTAVRRQGFEPEQALLPPGPRSFDGYRLLHEFYAFPDRFMFVEIGGLGPAVRRCEASEMDIVVLLDRADDFLEDTLDVGQFALYCAPAVNLFPKRADRIHISDQESEFHVLPERTRPIDFEVYEITNVEGIGAGMDTPQPFRPLYGSDFAALDAGEAAFYTTKRLPRLPSSRQRQRGPRSSYGGSEVFLSLVDANEAPYRSDLRQISVETMCTNRDLPLTIATGQGKTDFTLEVGAPVDSIRCLSGPTEPRASRIDGDAAWQLISHLSLNYLSLTDNADGGGAVALRQILGLYGDLKRAHVRKQIDGVRSIESRAVTRRIPEGGPVTFGRGIEIAVTFDEPAFEGTGVFLLGAVLEQFFAKYTSINSFTETVVRTVDRGEIMRWPARTGTRQTL